MRKNKFSEIFFLFRNHLEFIVPVSHPPLGLFKGAPDTLHIVANVSQGDADLDLGLFFLVGVVKNQMIRIPITWVLADEFPNALLGAQDAPFVVDFQDSFLSRETQGARLF